MSSQQQPQDIPGIEPSEEGKMIVFDLTALTTFNEKGPNVQILSDIKSARLVLFTFRAGQSLKEHQTSSQIFIQILQGEMILTVEERDLEANAGMLFQVEADIPHSLTARTDASVLLTLAPSPAFHHPADLFEDKEPLVKREQGRLPLNPSL